MNQQFKESFDWYITSCPFIAGMLFKLKLEINNEIDTACTCGDDIQFNESFFNSLNFKQRLTLIGHESLHIMFCHHLRMVDRNAELWNVACDHAINLLLKAMKFEPIDNWLCDEKYKGWKAEDIYIDLENQPQQNQDQQKQQSKDSCGNFSEPKKANGESFNDEEKQEKINQAKVDIQNARSTIERMVKAIEVSDMPDGEKEKRQTTISQGFSEIIEEIKYFTDKSLVNWRDILAEFISEKAPLDYTWQKPDNRFSDFILPSLDGEDYGKITLVLDVSGSMATIAKKVASEAFHCLEQMSSNGNLPQLEIIYSSTRIHDVVNVESIDDIKIVKGGSTAFSSTFDYLKTNESRAIIFVTDGVVYDFKKWVEPSTPLLWVLSHRNDYFRKHVPFGEITEFIS